MSALEIRNLSKRYGAVQALRAVSLTVSSDQLCVVLGPTGAGKTTLLRLLAGLEAADEGSIRLGGEQITDHSPAERDVALVFQNFSLYPGWTVRRNLEFPLRAPGRNLETGEIEERVSQAAAVLHIEHLLERDSAQLSGGEMQRVAIGRAIVRRPRLFLMDEPLSNLDAKLREELRFELVVLRRELGLPMIYVTHDQSEAMSMADRMAVLVEGCLLQEGTPDQLYEQPVSPQVARLLGQTRVNILPVANRSGRTVLPAASGSETADFEVVLAEHFAGPSPECLMGVRPEDIEVTGGSHPARVVVVEDAGPHLVVLAEWAGHSIHLLLGKTNNVPSPGDTINPKIRADRVIWWEKTKGEAP